MSTETAWGNGNENTMSDADGASPRVEDGMAGYASAGQDATVTDSMVGAVVAGRDAAASESFCGAAVAGRDLHLKQAFGGMLVAGNRATVEGSTVGLLLGANTTLTNSQVILTGRQALLLGAAAGAGFAVLSALLRRVRGR